MNKGKVSQIFGAVLDIKFEGEVPNILNALKYKDKNREIVFEVVQHIGDGVIRAIAMDLTDGLKRGDEVIDTGKPITVPVGKGTLGRIMDVIGNPLTLLLRPMVDIQYLQELEREHGRGMIYIMK